VREPAIASKNPLEPRKVLHDPCARPVAGRNVSVVNPNEPTWTHLLKEGPKPKVPCGAIVLMVLVALGALVTGLVIW
jgi:hypothetical protein